MYSQPQNLVERGTWGSVRYAIRASGAMEAKNFLESEADESVRAKFAHLFRALAAKGAIRNEQQFRKLRGEIWECKRDGHRILCFRDGNCWFLTHHYPKSKRKCPPSEIDRAESIRSEHISGG